jgi:hypothetical protein
MGVVVNPYEPAGPRLGPPSGGALVGLFVLWVLAGAAGLLTLLGLLTIGIFVLPFAAILLGTALWLTLRGPGRLPTMAGSGVSLGLAVAWLGVVSGLASPETASGWCAQTPDGAQECQAVGPEGPFDPNAFDWAAAAPLLVMGSTLACVAVAAFLVLARSVNPPAVRMG